MTQEEKAYHAAVANIEDIVQSQMFGKPCYKVKANKKAFCCFFQNEMVFKLQGDHHQEALAINDAQLFDPSGKKRPMKEWVQIPFTASATWPKYAIAALNYVQSK